LVPNPKELLWEYSVHHQPTQKASCIMTSKIKTINLLQQRYYESQEVGANKLYLIEKHIFSVTPICGKVLKDTI